MTSPSTPRPVPPGNARRVLLLIAGLPLTMILAATWLWYFVERGELDVVSLLGTANHGTLLSPPLRIDERPLLEQSGAEFDYLEGEPRWTLLIPGSVDCDAVCEHRLYTTRQLHVAMGRDMARIRRIYLVAAPLAEVDFSVSALSDQRPLPQNFADYLQQEHPRMPLLGGEGAAQLSEQLMMEVEPGSWYLVDPAGWIMMRYPPTVHYRDVMQDLKFLLKNS